MNFFLRHFAGFLIQIGASMLLCLIPFRKADFRYPRKWVLTGYSILAMVVSACFPLAKALMPYMPLDQPTILSNLYMLLVLAVFVALYFLVMRVAVIKKLIVLVLAVFYAATQYLLVNLTSPLFPQGNLPDTYPPLTRSHGAGHVPPCGIADEAGCRRLPGRNRIAEHQAGVQRCPVGYGIIFCHAVPLQLPARFQHPGYLVVSNASGFAGGSHSVHLLLDAVPGIGSAKARQRTAEGVGNSAVAV